MDKSDASLPEDIRLKGVYKNRVPNCSPAFVRGHKSRGRCYGSGISPNCLRVPTFNSSA